MLKLEENEYIVTAWPETCSGPGWFNTPIWVLIKNRVTNKRREDCIQPENQTAFMRQIFNVWESMHVTGMSAVNTLIKR